MPLFSIVPAIVFLLCSALEVASVKKYPTATRPPLPPPPPPRVVFPHNNDQVNRLQTFEMIAPTQVQQGFRPSLSLGNSDFNIQGATGHRPQPQRPQKPLKPVRPQPQQPVRPQLQQPVRPQQPLQPQSQKPQPQRPQQPHSQVSRPQLPFSRPVARPPTQLPQRPSVYQRDSSYYRYFIDHPPGTHQF